MSLAAGPDTCKQAILRDLPDLPAQEAGRQGYSFTIKFAGVELTDGVQVPPSLAKTPPTFEILQPATRRYEEREFGKMFSILCVDLDPPSPDNPHAREWLHWCRTNVFADKAVPGNVPCSWQGPSPPAGNHRYVFLLYEQPKGVIPSHDFELDKKRQHFNHKAWAEQKGLGAPLASLFFYSKPEGGAAAEPAPA